MWLSKSHKLEMEASKSAVVLAFIRWVHELLASIKGTMWSRDMFSVSTTASNLIVVYSFFMRFIGSDPNSAHLDIRVGLSRVWSERIATIVREPCYVPTNTSRCVSLQCNSPAPTSPPVSLDLRKSRMRFRQMQDGKTRRQDRITSRVETRIST